MKIEKIIILFSSHSTREYKNDNLKVLAFPPGHIMHFRYKTYEVEDELLNDIKKDLSRNSHGNRIIGKDILVVLIGNSEKNTDPKDFNFYPVRYGRIINVQIKNEVVHVYFELLDKIVKYPATSEINSQINDVMSKLKYEAFIAKIEPNGQRKYAVYSNSPDIINLMNENMKIQFDSGWVNIVSKLLEDPDYKGTLFYRFEITDKNGEIIYPKNRGMVLGTSPLRRVLKKTSLNKSEYQIIANEEYLLKLYFWAGEKVITDGTNKYIHITYNPRYLEILPDRIPIWVNADEKTILINPRAGKKDKLTNITITGDGMESAYIDDLVVRIKPKLADKNWVLYTLFATGIILSSGLLELVLLQINKILKKAIMLPEVLKIGLIMIGILLSTISIAKLSSWEE